MARAAGSPTSTGYTPESSNTPGMYMYVIIHIIMYIQACILIIHIHVCTYRHV